MGRGTPYYEHAIMVYIPFFPDNEQGLIDYKDWANDIYYTAEYALHKAEHVGEWEDSLYILAQNDKMRVALNHEDTFVQVICLPRYYRRWLSEENPTHKNYDTTGNNYQNNKGEWIVECEISYNIHRQAMRFFRRLCKAIGEVDLHNGTYKNIGVRTSAWTSARIYIDAFK